MLSVIVTSYRAGEILDVCLASLTAQPDAVEIIVADCSPSDPTERLRAQFPRVRVHHVAHTMTVAALRWSALPLTSGDLIAAVEGRSVPARDWCAELVRVHGALPDAVAVGGPVTLKPGATAFDRGLYLCEFAPFAPPIAARALPQLSGANLSYKRLPLLAEHDLLDAGCWEAAVHERWQRAGRLFGMSRGVVEFRNGMSPRDAVRMRFHYGRSYAADRFRGGTRRLLHAAAAPLLPFVLTWRAVRCARDAASARDFLRALHWVALLNIAWSAGELAGYAFGRSSRAHIY